MTDDAVRYVRSGDGQVSSRRIWPLGRVGAGDYCGCAATIVTVHEFSSRRSNSLVPFGRVGHRDAIEETWGRGAALRWMKRSPRASTHF